MVMVRSGGGGGGGGGDGGGGGGGGGDAGGEWVVFGDGVGEAKVMVSSRIERRRERWLAMSVFLES